MLLAGLERTATMLSLAVELIGPEQEAKVEAAKYLTDYYTEFI